MIKHMILGLLLCVSMAMAIQIESGDRIYGLTCNNNVSGALEGSTANITCYDSSGNTDVDNEAMTNVATGQFYYTFSETDDRYGCFINCITATSIDYGISVAQGQLLQTSDNIGINLDDTSGTLSDAEIETIDVNVASVDADAIAAGDFATGAIDADAIAASAIGASELATNAIGAAEIASGAIDADAIAANAIGASEVATDAIGAAEAGFLTDSTGFDGADIAAILTDTAGQDTAGEWDTLMATALSYIDGDGSDGIDADIDDIKTDTNELQQNQSNFVTASGFATSTQATNILANQTTIYTHGDSAWITAVGFSTHAASDVYEPINTSLKAGIVVLTAATESQIDSIDTDAAAAVANQSVILNAIEVIDGIVDAILVDTGAFDTAAEYAAAIWNAVTGSYGGAGTYGQAVEDTLADTDEIQQNQSNFVSGSASITDSDKQDIATYVGNKSINCTDFRTDSLGCTVWAIERYN